MEKGTKLPRPGERATALFRDLAPGGPEAEERTMFGMPCAFVHGNMFMGLFGDTFMLRLGPADRTAAEAVGAAPFSRMGRTMKEYVALPIETLDADALRPWADRAYAFAAALPAKAAKPRAASKTTNRAK